MLDQNNPRARVCRSLNLLGPGVAAAALARVKSGALLINTSRGGSVDTEAAIEALKSGQLGGMAIDVYEEEAGLFFRDLSSTVIKDDVIQRLVSFPNVIVTGHQAFSPGSDQNDPFAEALS